MLMKYSMGENVNSNRMNLPGLWEASRTEAEACAHLCLQVSKLLSCALLASGLRCSKAVLLIVLTGHKSTFAGMVWDLPKTYPVPASEGSVREPASCNRPNRCVLQSVTLRTIALEAFTLFWRLICLVACFIASTFVIF